MRRTDPKSSKRARILDDDEIRTVWTAAKANGTFGAIIRLALLTAQRRQKIMSMRWEDVTIDGVWNIPAEPREKGSGGALVLPAVAIEVIRSQPVISGNPYIFPGRTDGYSNSHHVFKRRIDEQAQIEPWVIHDLRRTSRSLMASTTTRDPCSIFSMAIDRATSCLSYNPSAKPSSFLLVC